MGYRVNARTGVLVLFLLGSSAATSQASVSTLQAMTSLEAKIRELYKQSSDKAAVRPALDQALSALRRAQKYQSRGQLRLAESARGTAWAAVELASRQIAYEVAREAHQDAYRHMASAENEAATTRQTLRAALHQRAHVSTQEP